MHILRKLQLFAKKIDLCDFGKLFDLKKTGNKITFVITE